MTTLHLRTIAALLLLFVLSGCKTTIDPLPLPPAGTHVFGNKLNQASYDIMEMNDGGFLLLGGSQEEDKGDYDIYLLKTDSQGEMMWERRFRKSNTDEFGVHIREMAGGYAVLAFRSGGNSYSGNFVLFILDEDFNKQWERVIPGTIYTGGNQKISNGFFVMNNGNFLLANNINYQPSYLILDPNGTVISENTWFSSRSINYFNFVADVVRLNDGSYMFAGPGQGANYEAELYVQFLDADGNEDFFTTIPNFNNGFEVSVIGQRADSSLYFFLQDYTSNSRLEMVSVPGKSNFTETREEIGDNISLYNGITLPSGNALVIGGTNPRYTSSFTNDFSLYEISPDGDLIFTKTWGGANSDLARQIIRSADNRNVMFGQTQSYGAGGTDFCLIID